MRMHNNLAILVPVSLQCTIRGTHHVMFINVYYFMKVDAFYDKIYFKICTSWHEVMAVLDNKAVELPSYVARRYWSVACGTLLYVTLQYLQYCQAVMYTVHTDPHLAVESHAVLAVQHHTVGAEGGGLLDLPAVAAGHVQHRSTRGVTLWMERQVMWRWCDISAEQLRWCKEPVVKGSVPPSNEFPWYFS